MVKSVLESILQVIFSGPEVKPTAFHPVIQEFQDLIENDTTLFMLFNGMFDEIPNQPLYDKDLSGQPQIRNYHEMLAKFDCIIRQAPVWDDDMHARGFIGFPINAMLNWPMATSSGRAAFLDERVNRMFRKMLTAWSQVMSSPASTSVLGDGPKGWLSSKALQELTQNANLQAVEGLSFQDVYVCDPSKPFWGFTSWDNFFTRIFKEGARPISDPSDPAVIVAPCESAPYCFAQNVSERDKFWIKAQPYSLEDMLARDELVSRFVGGTIFQAYLSALTYHRWHSPVAGRVVKAYSIPGTYYSQTASNCFESGDPDPSACTRSQAYLTAVAARAAIFIQADNDDIGMVCVLPVGMAEVSSCEITVRPGQHVQKGQEIGMFHFGGSTVCLIFEQAVELSWEKACLPPYPDDIRNIALGSKIATVVHT